MAGRSVQAAGLAGGGADGAAAGPPGSRAGADGQHSLASGMREGAAWLEEGAARLVKRAGQVSQLEEQVLQLRGRLAAAQDKARTDAEAKEAAEAAAADASRQAAEHTAAAAADHHRLQEAEATTTRLQQRLAALKWKEEKEVGEGEESEGEAAEVIVVEDSEGEGEGEPVAGAQLQPVGGNGGAPAQPPANTVNRILAGSWEGYGSLGYTASTPLDELVRRLGRPTAAGAGGPCSIRLADGRLLPFPAEAHRAISAAKGWLPAWQSRSSGGTKFCELELEDFDVVMTHPVLLHTGSEILLQAGGGGLTKLRDVLFIGAPDYMITGNANDLKALLQEFFSGQRRVRAAQAEAADAAANRGISVGLGRWVCGMRHVTLAAVSGVQHPASGAPFCLLARPHGKQQTASSVAHVEALQEAAPRALLRDAVSLCFPLDGLASAEMHMAALEWAERCVGEGERRQLEAQGSLSLHVMELVIHGLDAAGQRVVAKRSMWLDLQKPSPADVDKVKGEAPAAPAGPATRARGAGRRGGGTSSSRRGGGAGGGGRGGGGASGAAEDRQVSTSPAVLRWAAAQLVGQGAPPLPAFAAADPGQEGGQAARKVQLSDVNKKNAG